MTPPDQPGARDSNTQAPRHRQTAVSGASRDCAFNRIGALIAPKPL
jgi:hypothetical protein